VHGRNQSDNTAGNHVRSPKKKSIGRRSATHLPLGKFAIIHDNSRMTTKLG
jgi:hypothetical protein